MKKKEFDMGFPDFAEALLDNGHSLRFRMQGNSMYPTLKANDIGTIVKCSPEEVIPGDIIIFKKTDKLIAHRLIKIVMEDNIRLYVTKGDKNYQNDIPFTAEAIIGKLSCFQRNKIIRSPEGFRMKLQGFTSLHFPRLKIMLNNAILSFNIRIDRSVSLFRTIRSDFSVITQNSGKEMLLNVLFSCLQGILPFVLILCIKALIDLITGTNDIVTGKQYVYVPLMFGTALVFLSNGLLTEVKAYLSSKLTQSVTRSIYSMLHHKHDTLDLSCYENPEDLNKIHRAVQEASFRPVKMINGLLNSIRSVAAAIFLLVLFLAIRWELVVLLFTAIIPGVLVRLKFSKRFYELKKTQSSDERRMYYYHRILTGFVFAKELKLFGFYSYFLQRFNTTQDTLFKQKRSHCWSELNHSILSGIFAAVLLFISLGYVFSMKLNNEISLGRVVLFFFAIQRGYPVLNDLFMSVTQILEDTTFFHDFTAFMNLPSRTDEHKKESSPFPLKKEIKIENVSFKYESSKREALKSVNITIPAGKTVAFVGANGSGKTTLMKLLCGFYRPDSGRILFDGVDIAQIGQKTVCENTTAIFQDFALYHIPVLENIGLGNIQTDFDPDKAKKAAVAAGIDELIEKLPEGYNTLLGSSFSGGEDLSIGQWQKMAMARAFYRDSDLTLLDEPSGAMDVDAELQIIGNLKKSFFNKTTVIISHRLTTVQWVDMICFFENGEVLETGNHQDLMALQGKYYSLFQSVRGRE